jgi:hypothetical protein
MKMKLRHAVETLYEFDPNQTARSIGYNAAHAKELLTKVAFIYRARPHCIAISSALIPVRSQDHNFHKFSGDCYQHPIIQKAINILWFKNMDDDGMTFHEHFSPMPIPAIALVLTVVGINIVPDYPRR